MMLNNADDLCRISDKEDHCHCPGSKAVEPDELSAAREVGLNPLSDSSGDAVVVLEPTEQDLVVDHVECDAEVKQAK